MTYNIIINLLLKIINGKHQARRSVKNQIHGLIFGISME